MLVRWPMARGAPASRLSHVSPDVCSPAGRVGGVRVSAAVYVCVRALASTRARARARARVFRAYSFMGEIAALPWLALALLQPGHIHRARVSRAGEGEEFSPPLRDSSSVLLSPPPRRTRRRTDAAAGGGGTKRLEMVTARDARSNASAARDSQARRVIRLIIEGASGYRAHE